MTKKVEYKKLLLILVLPLLIFSKIVQFKFMPAKYLYDGNSILFYVKHMPEYIEGSYRFTVLLFRKINFFNFETLVQWATLITILYTPIIYTIIKRYTRNIDIYKFIYLCSGVFLVGMYIFNVGKDIIQMTIFLLIDVIILTRKIEKPFFKILLCSLLFAYESIIFRSYYILTSIFTIVLYFILKQFIYSKSKIKIKKVLRVVFSILITLFIFMLITKRFLPKEYNQLMVIRTSLNQYRENSPNAVTMINDIFKNGGNIWIWMLNYIINFIRIMIPVELLFISIRYMPFIVFQIFVTYYLVISLNQINSKNTVMFSSLCVFIAYLMTSFLFEPDFGSFVRHEAATFPVLINILNNTPGGNYGYETGKKRKIKRSVIKI